eukprot:358026_1
MSAPFASQLNTAKNNILIFGYARRILIYVHRPTAFSLFEMIPDSVVSVISKHYNYKQCSGRAMSVWNSMIKEDTKHDIWNANLLHDSYRIDPNNKYILTRTNDGDINPYSFGEHVIGTSKSDIMVWKLKILKPELWYIGIINANIQKNETWCQINSDSYIWSTQDGCLYSRGKWIRKEQKCVFKHQKNKILYLLVDFAKQSMSINFDDKFEKILDGIKMLKSNNGYRLAIGMGANCKVQLLCATRMQYIYRKRKMSSNIKLYIKWTKSNNKYQININRFATVKEVKLAIEKREGIKNDQIKIIYKRKLLSNKDKLIDKGVGSGKTLYAML